MLLLAIDTSAVASAALLNASDTDTGQAAAGRVQPQLLAGFATEDTRSHAEVLAPGIEQLLADAGVTGNDLDALVVGVGPGPFTGLRSGIVTARTLAFVWKVPLHGMMSLEALAWTAANSNAGQALDRQDFLVATDARRKEVYWARYTTATGSAPTDDSRLPVLADGPHVGPAVDMPALPVFGAGAGLYAADVDAVAGYERHQPDAGALGALALLRLAAGEPLPDTTPLYLRESDARVPGPRKRAL